LTAHFLHNQHFTSIGTIASHDLLKQRAVKVKSEK